MLKRLQWGATCAADATTSQYRVRYGSYLLFISRRAAHVMRPPMTRSLTRLYGVVSFDIAGRRGLLA